MATEDGRIGRVEGILEEVRARLNNIDNRFDNLESSIEARFYWLMGVIITMWVTIILAVLLN